MRDSVNLIICDGNVFIDRLVDAGDDDEAEPAADVEPPVPRLPLLSLVEARIGAFLGKFTTITFMAFSSCPTPVLPSYVSLHLEPHAVPLSSPVQDLAAPEADVCKYFEMVGAVKGAICMVAPIHCAVKPLKAYWSLLQVSTGSQAISTMIGGWLLRPCPKK